MTGPADKGARREVSGKPTSRRSLRAILSADLAGFSGQVSVDETHTLMAFKELREIALAQLEQHNGWLFGMPGDGLFALFESAIDALECALDLQRALGECHEADGLRMRIGIHMGEVLFDNELPFGEALAIAARLEALAEPGGILISAPVFDAASPRVSAAFEERGTPRLKNIPRRIPTYSVRRLPERTASPGVADETPTSLLDQTMVLDRRQLRQIRDSNSGVARAQISQSVDAASPPPRTSDADPQQASRIEGPEDGTPSAPPAGESGIPPTVETGPLSGAGVPRSESTSDVIPGKLRDQIAGLMVFYVGPMARVLVDRYAERADTPDELIVFLEDEIPDPDERMAFRLRATQVVLNQARP